MVCGSIADTAPGGRPRSPLTAEVAASGDRLPSVSALASSWPPSAVAKSCAVIVVTVLSHTVTLSASSCGGAVTGSELLKSTTRMNVAVWESQLGAAVPRARRRRRGLETIVPVQLGYFSWHAANSLSKAVSPPVSVPSNSTCQLCVMVTSTVTLVLLGRLATDAVNWPIVMLSGGFPTVPLPSTMASCTVNCLGAAGGGGGEGLGGSGEGGGGDGEGGGGEGAGGDDGDGGGIGGGGLGLGGGGDGDGGGGDGGGGNGDGGGGDGGGGG